MSDPDGDQALDPSRVFERYVESNPQTCNCCYARPLPEETDGIDIEATGEIIDEPSTHRYDWEIEDACPVCGSVGMSSPDETLSIEAASQRAIRLSSRLRERGIRHDWRHLVWFVREAKRRDGLHAKDREIAARAVEFAVSQYS